MSRPEQRAAAAGNDASVIDQQHGSTSASCRDDGRANRPTATSLPSAADAGRSTDSAATAVRDPTSHHAGARGAGRLHQFRKAKSAATFMLDGVSYTIGEYGSGV